MEMNQLTFFLTRKISTACGSTNCQAAPELDNQKDLYCYLLQWPPLLLLRSPYQSVTNYRFKKPKRLNLIILVTIKKIQLLVLKESPPTKTRNVSIFVS